MAIVMILALAGGGAACGRGPQDAAKHARFAFLAVLEGLYEQALDTELARAVVQAPAPGLFVAKCPVCDPARAAFQGYAANPRPGSIAFGESAVPKEIADGLRSTDRAAQMKALQSFIAGCVERKLARTVMTDAERAGFKLWAAEGRKFGMSVKPAGFGDACPSCEGVHGKK